VTEQPNFVRLQDSIYDDWQRIRSEFMAYPRKLPLRVIDHLKLLHGDFGGFPVDRYTHCLQTATRALRDGRDEEYVVCALLHRIASENCPKRARRNLASRNCRCSICWSFSRSRMSLARPAA
jgi:hypothetical protein